MLGLQVVIPFVFILHHIGVLVYDISTIFLFDLVSST